VLLHAPQHIAANAGSIDVRCHGQATICLAVTEADVQDPPRNSTLRQRQLN
jgi:hypothetical protein